MRRHTDALKELREGKVDNETENNPCKVTIVHAGPQRMGLKLTYIPERGGLA